MKTYSVDEIAAAPLPRGCGWQYDLCDETMLHLTRFGVVIARVSVTADGYRVDPCNGFCPGTWNAPEDAIKHAVHAHESESRGPGRAPAITNQSSLF